MPPFPFIRTWPPLPKFIELRSHDYPPDALYRLIFKDGFDEHKVQKQLNLFYESHKRIYKWEVWLTIEKLRELHYYSTALKLSRTMRARGMIRKWKEDAIHLDLIHRVEGLQAAEYYFIKLPDIMKGTLAYASLVNVYCRECLPEKAEALLAKMKELKLLIYAAPYNSLMGLYAKMGTLEKIPPMIQDIKDNYIKLTPFSYNMWMRSLAAANDISGVGKVFKEMKNDDDVKVDWMNYWQLTQIFINAGQLDKAEKTLRKMEEWSYKRQALGYYHLLISMYRRVGNLVAVYRAWRLLGLARNRVPNRSHQCLLRALVRLKDMPGAEKCFSEWELACKKYDIRVPNVLIVAYARASEIDKALLLIERARERGVRPDFLTARCLIDAFLKMDRFDDAARYVRMAASLRKTWGPRSWIVEKMMGYYEACEDVESAERFLSSTRRVLDKVGVYEALLRIYAAAGKTSATMRHRIRMNEVVLSAEGRRLLDKISVDRATI